MDSSAHHGGSNKSGRRFGLFVAWVVAPLVLLALVESGLRAGGYGHSTNLFVPRVLNGETVYKTNRAFFQKFFTMSIGWGPQDYVLPAAKASDTYRIFVFGSSAAEGVPAPDFSFARILGTMLRARAPELKIEIYNMAIAGANSHVMRAAAEACAAQRPDLFVVYMGNNEMNPLVTRRLLWDRLPAPLGLRLLHASTALSALRLVQWSEGAPRDGAETSPGPTP
jgi:hypothetical protein